jgi:hypothetical protein
MHVSTDTHSRLSWSAGIVNTGKLTAMAKRGYSREFTPQTERRIKFEIDRIPPTLYEAVKAKAKREGVSLRALTLGLWKDWAAK